MQLVAGKYSMLKKSTLLHLRIPFSLYLMPFFCFALSQTNHIHVLNLLLSFVIIHLLFYPASNGFNSYFDKDEQSIGGLKYPPKVDKELYRVSLAMDALALLLGILISINFMLMLLIIGMVSKAYSHPLIRLKKYPVLGLFTVALFQGSYTYFMSLVAIENISLNRLLEFRVIAPALLCSLLLLGSYPMTQVYQHEEDGKRGDKTLSLMLGVKGTFLWTGGIFAFGVAGFYFYLTSLYSLNIFLILLLSLSPTLIFFLIWFLRILKDEKAADFDSTMMLNKLSSFGFIGFFLFLTLYRHGAFN